MTFLMLVAVAFFSGCGKPPKGAATYDLLDFTMVMLKNAEELQNDQKKLVEFAIATSALDIVLSWGKDEEIIFTSKDFNPSPDHFVVSIPGNMFKTVKPIYVTNGQKNEFLYSLDGETWYRTRNENDKQIENLHIDFFYDMVRDKTSKKLFLSHRIAARIGESAVPQTVRGRRKLVSLQSGQIYSHTEKKRVDVNLDNHILYLPPGTILKGNFLLSGNLLSSRLTRTDFTMKALRDLYLFRKGFMFGVSFNNEEWNNGILSFDIKFAQILYSPEQGALAMDIALNLIHKPTAEDTLRYSVGYDVQISKR